MNHLADYLSTTDAGQREGVIRKAKFPRKLTVVTYQQIMPALRKFISGNSGDLRILDDLIARLEAKARREEGYSRDEALRCINAVEAFKAAYLQAKLGKFHFDPGSLDVVFKVADVSINVRLDPPISEHAADGRVFSGGCVMLLASSPEGRKDIQERQKHVAAVTHWALESTATNTEPLARLCVSFDVFGSVVVKAPAANDRLRKKVAAACREVFDSWARVEPPAGYDGPDWH